MRRIFFLLVVVACLASPSWAAGKIQSVTVARFGQWLAGAHGQPDSRLAKQIGAFALTERVSLAQFARWQSDLPGRRSRQALTALADATVLLAPPPDEILPDAPPDRDTQSAILSRAHDYVVQTLAHLPDFSAVRTTESFADIPVPKARFQFLHFTGESTFPVSYRNGLETHGEQKANRANLIPLDNRRMSGIATAGEFGPILSIVLDDATHGSVQWGYWEQSPGGRLAVFRYSVPERQSNYLLSFTQFFLTAHVVPAYFGELAIDPATGAIFRISIFTNSVPSANLIESAITVDYGHVQLGGRDYICPLKGVALMTTLVDASQGGTGLRTYVNDTAFTGYSLFRADITILPAQ